MTFTYHVRTDLGGPVPAAGDRVLDWVPGSRAATIQMADDFFTGWRPTRQSLDLMLLGASTYCVDKTADRATQPDAWTRDIRLHLPVADAPTWDATGAEAALDFLTGDRWQIKIHPSSYDPLAGARKPAAAVGGIDADAVCLFSGGLDHTSISLPVQTAT